MASLSTDFLRVAAHSLGHLYHLNRVGELLGLAASFTSSWAYTAFLFTYTDYKTIFFPIIAFSVVAAPPDTATSLAQGAVWIWIHLLQCNVSNQYKSAVEDLVNRPWRPLPSGRISLEQASRLRWAVFVLCAAYSVMFGWDVLLTSLALTMTMVIYDEVGLAGTPLGKNICAVSGYATFEIGATNIFANGSELDLTAKLSVGLSMLIILTTIHVQDFPDIDGDLASGRRTVPIAYPSSARAFTPLIIIAWTIALSLIWSVGPEISVLLAALSLLVAHRVACLRAVEEERRTYLLYNLWLFTVHILPLNSRWGNCD